MCIDSPTIFIPTPKKNQFHEFPTHHSTRGTNLLESLTKITTQESVRFEKKLLDFTAFLVLEFMTANFYSEGVQ